ncbi:Uncharacterised protein [Mycobacterium tuberculosis]|jgi:hypothetical protein|nr:Uncharacterised protein [Mycobacterium tuberculosis]
MVQSGMRITVDAAMRARDVSRPRPDGEEPPAAAPGRAAEPARRTKAAKNARRREGKRGAAARRPADNGL